MKYLMWLLKAAIFFTLFAFALNNQQAVAVHFFFGTFWQAPLVLVVLTAFACGLALGVLVMMPRWWKKRKPAHPTVAGASPLEPSDAMTDTPMMPHHGI
jgi:putative membrane protein